MELATTGANGHALPSEAPTVLSGDVVIKHLAELLGVTLGASSEDLEGFGSLLSDQKRHDTIYRCTRFASESQVSLYVQKNYIDDNLEGEKSNGHFTSPGRTIFKISRDPS